MKMSNRNLGIDILRIVSMLCVVVLHVLGHGGILDLDNSPALFSTVWLFEVLAFPAVNCFVLIAGYVGYKGNTNFPKIKNILNLLFTVLFYSITIFLIFYFFGFQPLGIKDSIKNFIPTITGKYWFFTAYFGVFLVSPMLNSFVHKSDFKHSFVLFTVLLLFSVISVFRDTFALMEGYSFIWFMFMYLVGAIVKKYNISKLLSKKMWLTVFSAFAIITWISKILLHFTDVTSLQNQSEKLVNYVSPTIVIMSIALVCLFSKINCPSSFSKIISFFSTSAFSVYLIHDNCYVREHLISHIHNIIVGHNYIFAVLSILFIVPAIFITCTLIDKLRIILFRVIKIDKLSERIEAFVKTKINAACEKIKLKIQTTAE